MRIVLIKIKLRVERRKKNNMKKKKLVDYFKPYLIDRGMVMRLWATSK